MTEKQQEQVERWYEELHKLMWAMVWDHATTERFYLNPDDMFGELCEDLVRLIQRYGYKPDEELKPLLIVSLRNRCYDMLFMEFRTHRVAEGDNISLDADAGDAGSPVPFHEWGTGCIGGEAYYFDLDGLLAGLGDDAYLLVMEILDPSERMGHEIRMAAARRQATRIKDRWVVSTNKRICQRALGWTRLTTDKAWREIQDVMAVI